MSILKQISVEISAIKRTKNDFRNFGLLVGLIFVALGFYFLSYGTISLVLIIVGFWLTISGLFAPRTLLYPYLAWMTLAVFLGFFVFRILLVVIYFCVIVPTGLMLRLFSFNKPNESKKTYWVKVVK